MTESGSTIGAHTHLLDAWLAQEDLMDRLVAYDGRVGAFLKVLSDEHVARQLTLSDVASMVGCPVQPFVRIASGTDTPPPHATGPAGETYLENAPDGLAGHAGITIDARPILEAGREPLPAILLAVGALEGDEVLEVISPFEPKPLRRLLAHRGFMSHATEVAPDHFRTVFLRQTEKPAVPAFAIAAIFCEGPGPTGHVLTQVAADLERRGHRLAGVVQSMPYSPGDAHCAMSLSVLPTREVVPITQDLGSQASSCRLDHQALEDAVALVDKAFALDTELLLVNKFGKREAEGAGFRQTIARAVEAGVPVLVGVGPRELASLEDFVGGTCPILADDGDTALAWCLGQLHAATGVQRQGTAAAPDPR